MAVTLADEMALETDPLRKGIILALIKQVMLQDRIPWETTGAMHLAVTYLSGIPVVPLRHLNETPAASQATFAQANETLHILDTDIDIDPVLRDNKNQVMDIDVAQTRAVMASVGYRINDLFINADPASNAREPRGIKIRLRDDARFNGQTVNATGSTTELDFRLAASDANRLTTLAKIDELIYLLEGADVTSALISSRQFVLSFSAALRALKLLDTTQDQFGRWITLYRQIPILDAGYKPAQAVLGSPDSAGADTNQIIGNDADNYSGSNDPGSGNGATAYDACTTIYAVRFGPDYLVGLQQSALRVKPLGDTQESPHYYRTNIRWVMNPSVPFQKRAIARLVGVAVTTTPA